MIPKKSISNSQNYDRAFRECMQINTKVQNIPISVIQSLVKVISESEEQTINGLLHEIERNISFLCEAMLAEEAAHGKSNLTIKSLCQIFYRVLSRKLQRETSAEIAIIKTGLKSISENLINLIESSREKISDLALTYIRKNTVILVNGNSKIICHVLKEAKKKGIIFSVVVTESRPYCEGYNLYQELTNEKIPCKIIIDSAVAYCLEEIDFVMVGAEAVVENGGIINRIGTYTLALCAKALKKPFYVVAESYKFLKEYPLAQRDLPKNLLRNNDFKPAQLDSADINVQCLQAINPLCDYTPPHLISLLFTDLGISTPTAVSDELLQIFDFQLTL